MNEPSKPNWDYWSNMAVVELREAVELSCDVQPGSLRVYEAFSFIPASILPLLNMVESRLSIAHAHIGQNLPSHTSKSDRYYGPRPATGVQLVEFRTWGESLPSPFTFPDEFPKADVGDMESAHQRKARLQARVDELKKQGVRAFNKAVAAEESISVSRLKQILAGKNSS